MTLNVPENKSKNIESIYSLSPMQEGLLFHTLYEGESGVYFEQLSFNLSGNLNVTVFEQAWQRVVERHPVLRTLFVWENSKKPLQVVRKKVNLPWANYDWRNLSAVEQEEKFQTFLQVDRDKGFELDKAPLMRNTLIRLSEQTYKFIWSSHHLLTDGWCLPIILKEVFTFYEALNKGEDLYLPSLRPYKDYINWLQKQDFSTAKAFWQQTLQGFTASTPLVVDQVVQLSSQHKSTYQEQHLRLSEKTTSALKSLVKQHHLTLSTLLQGIWALLLSRYSGESDVIFGATVSGRPPTLSGVESMVGLFINTLPVRVQVSGDTELFKWLEQLQSQHLEREQYSWYPLVEIQRFSEIPGGRPLFESLVVFENYPVGSSLLEDTAGLEIDQIKSYERTNYPLTLVVIPGEELLVRMLYDCSRFDADTITRMGNHFLTLLEGVVINPTSQLQDLSLITEVERHQLLVEWNDTHTKYPDKCIHQLFSEQVQRTPQNIALQFDCETLTYEQLNNRANQLADYLITLGVKPDVLVGLCVERSIDMVVGLLAILKAGGAYVPLDPSYPQERLAYMLSDSQASVLLTQNSFLDYLPKHEKVVCLDKDMITVPFLEEISNISTDVKPENLAYVIYTSGSTGKPKGVAMSNRSLVNLLMWQIENGIANRDAKTLQFSPISFDVSFQEIFSTLCAGGTLVLIPDDVRRDAIALLKLLTEQKIERLFLPFVALQQLAEVAASSDYLPVSLREIITAGEQLQMTTALTNFLTRLPNCTLQNQYGPSETHVVTAFTLEPNADTQKFSSLPPIGRPIANTQIYILNSHHQPVPINVPGELYIGGVGLAREYLNRSDLTTEKFVPNPFVETSRGHRESPTPKLYKTGDLARYLPDGNIEFLGRIDNQVKIRGFRIELGEIETALTAHPQISEAVVMLREDEPNKKRLVGYIVIQNPKSKIQNILRDFLKQELPEYMVPSVFVFLDALPLTPSGKIDRRRLPVPSVSHDLESFVPPRTPTEENLAQIWQEVLGLEQVSIHDNFFECGGHSLLATQVISRLRQNWKIELPLRRLFEKPTVAQLAASIDLLLSTAQKLTEASPSHLLENQAEREEIEL
ncbi:amino acid adenylation domain-containing protein [Plectonema cf. radiosum LEGE 06105]|uniref:Amino acid adenylation domain-containing protein n=1 Tax=Plectonema cf. radiosum LEGE 06105 TaxID=945769 RepID=A0A8J7EY26_9CYAN|nr:non-ribosomal peptide synthetase [Plectonema radiosum]MBE9211187.1 amino acid adenylation domain-containing protein [Plectonema cf. radiosum LEGE 06105]